jgi:RNA polymerase sigma factor (sigma-70 family)
MASRYTGSMLRDIQWIFHTGTAAGLTDAQLLECFRARRDEAAFEALVRRHGPMVLGVCRRVLGNPHDAQDAFQATFLILARKAGSMRAGNSLGPWFYGVARRVALRSRANISRRRDAEQWAASPVGTDPALDADQCELRAVVREEVALLPEKYRAPVELCDLGGMTHERAARRLGWPVGTVSVRLMRARERLRVRLTRRGLAPSAGLLAAALADESASGALPAALVESTVQAAGRIAAGKAATVGAVSASVTLLTSVSRR